MLPDPPFPRSLLLAERIAERILCDWLTGYYENASWTDKCVGGEANGWGVGLTRLAPWSTEWTKVKSVRWTHHVAYTKLCIEIWVSFLRRSVRQLHGHQTHCSEGFTSGRETEWEQVKNKYSTTIINYIVTRSVWLLTLRLKCYVLRQLWVVSPL